MLAHYETGRSFPKPAMLRKLARYYQVTETDLLRDEESPTCQQEERTQPLNSPTISQFRERLASEATVEVTPGIPLSDEHRMFLIKQFDLLLTAYQQAH